MCTDGPSPSLGQTHRSTSQGSLNSNPPDVPPRPTQRPLSSHGDIPHSPRISQDVGASPRYDNSEIPGMCLNEGSSVT